MVVGGDPPPGDKEMLAALLRRACLSLRAAHPGIIMVLDHKIVEECAIQAALTLSTYNMDDSADFHRAPNHFKEAGHYAYWLRKLKPLQVVTPAGLASVLNAIGVRHQGIDNIVQSESAKGIVLVNEFAALYVAKKIVVSAENFIIDGLRADSKYSEEMHGEVLAHRASVLRRIEKMSGDIIMSIRYNSHSPNSMAILVEALFGSALEFLDP